VGSLPRASHEIGAQGQLAADLEQGGGPELVMSSGHGVYYFVVSDDPNKVPWTRHLIVEESSDEGIEAMDVDGDGLIDVVTTSGDTKRVEVQLHPKTPEGRWETKVIATLPEAGYLDRVAAADLNRDGRVDVIVTEEHAQPSGASTYWLEQPVAAWSGEWVRHRVVTQGSTNSLGVGDIDGDGDQDLVLGEHKGALKVSEWLNDGAGGFSQRILGAGMESHLGARLVDLDSDGDLDVVSIAWDEPESVFVLWNEARRK
jgi:hypothetical protein